VVKIDKNEARDAGDRPILSTDFLSLSSIARFFCRKIPQACACGYTLLPYLTA